jgi:hypothetical protein
VASLLYTAFGMPIVASLATVLMFSTKMSWFLGSLPHWQPVHAVVYGILIAVICWLALSIFFAAAGFTTLQRANTGVYLDLRRQFWAAVDSLPPANPAPEDAAAALAQARRAMGHGLRLYRSLATPP